LLGLIAVFEFLKDLRDSQLFIQVGSLAFWLLFKEFLLADQEICLFRGPTRSGRQ
jgi:hypothetical protein